MIVLSRLRQMLRSLVRRPSFTVPAVLTLALGVASTTAVFSVVYALLLRPLPFADASRLVRIWGSDLHSGEPRSNVSLPDFREWSVQNRSFEAIAAYQPQDGSLNVPGTTAERISEALATANLFPVLGVNMTAGRPFSPAEDRIGGAAVAIISHDLWTSRYGRDPGAIGRTMILDGVPHTIVGVVEAGASFPPKTDVWLPLEAAMPPWMRERSVRSLGVVARLRPAASVQSAQRDMDVLCARLQKSFPADDTGRGALVEPLRDALIGSTRDLVRIVFAAVLLLLVLCCANVAALILVRQGQREQEIAIRLALGASRATLVVEAFSESLITGAAAGVTGVMAAAAAVAEIVRLAPTSLPMRSSIALDWRVVVFAFAVAIATSAIAGVIPLLRRAAIMHSVVRPAGRSVTGSQSRGMRRLLVVGELALAVTLTCGALLLIRSYRNLAATSPGIAHLDVITAELQLPDAKTPRQDDGAPRPSPRMAQACAEVLGAIRRLPEITSAALAMDHPLRAGWTTGGVTIPGRPPDNGPPDQFRMRAITAGYASTVGLALLAGRDLGAADTIDAEPVVVINRAMAEKYFAGANPIDRTIVLWGTPRRIVGVFADERFLGLQEGSAPALYPPLDQIWLPSARFDLVVRSRQPLAPTMTDVRSTLAAIDGDISVSHPATLAGIASDLIAPQRFTMVLLSAFGSLSLVLAAIGVFGLIAYQVSLRARELGIRAALGAERSRLVLLIVREAAVLSAVAAAAGTAGALLLTRFLERLLFGVSPTDPATLAASALALAVIGICAAAVPALRASRVDPMTALRAE